MKWEELNNQFLQPPPLVLEFLNEATIDSVLLAALERFEDKATDRLLLSALGSPHIHFHRVFLLSSEVNCPIAHGITW